MQRLDRQDLIHTSSRGPDGVEPRLHAFCGNEQE
jgi:hypothetical protein